MSAIDPSKVGRAGQSARGQAEAIRARRESQAAERSTVQRVGRLLFGPSSTEKKSLREERAWTTGAAGEEMLARDLSRRCPNVVMLHDLRIPGSRANIDHIAVAPTGILVIDAKRYKGKIRVETPWRGPQRLRIAGRDRTKLIVGLDKQVSLVAESLSGIADDIRVSGCLCFLAPEGWLASAELPAFRTLRVHGYPLYGVRRLARELRRDGPLSAERLRAIQILLAQSFPPAAAS
jgi:Nuclease-related domain